MMMGDHQAIERTALEQPKWNLTRQEGRRAAHTSINRREGGGGQDSYVGAYQHAFDEWLSPGNAHGPKFSSFEESRGKATGG